MAYQGCNMCRGDTPFELVLDMAFQPVLDIETGRVFAYEALVRGEAGQGADWVLAQIDDHTCHTFDQQVRETAVRKAVGLGLLKTDALLHINFMPGAVIDALRCLQHIIAVCRETGLPADRVVFEFTEYQKLDEAKAQDIIRVYRKCGYQTAIDDFGAGYSGLNTLANLRTDIVKLDMGLIRGLDANVERAEIVAATVALLHRLKRTVIAEGIETAGELAAVRATGVRLVQGYYIARPALDHLPLAAFPGELTVTAVSVAGV